MKTILNLIITTLGVLFILSACGGGGVTVGLVNQTCTKNVFSLDCGSSGQATRTTTITDCVKDSTDCADNIPPAVQTCLTDLFGDDCDAVAETIASRTSVTVAELQMTFCDANPEDMNCTPSKPEPTLVEVCTGNPFNSRCLTDYNGARETACRGDTTGLDCTATITRFCETEATASPANVFNPLCATYDTAREIACRTGNYDSLCPATITQFCETDATPANGNTLNPLCTDAKYNGGREAACRTGNHDSLCPATITRYCETDATSNPDNTFNSLCDNNNLAKMVRNSFCMDTGNNNANPFSMRCVENAEAVNIRNNHCGMGAENGATATAFTDMRCVDDTKGLEVRNTYCVIGGDDLTGNAFKAECALNPDAHTILLASSECMGTTVDSYPLGEDIKFRRGCLATLAAICRAGVTSFDTRCESVTTERCGEALGWLYEPLCAGDDYQVRRENACLGQRPDPWVNGCRDTVYLRFCGAGSENPFDTGAGATGMINCLALDNSRRYGVQDYVGFRQSVCGNSRPVPDSKFETECNSLIMGLCTADAFDQTAGAANYNCYTDEAFNPQRNTHRKTCTTGTASALNPNCFELAVLEPCTRDPLREECDPEEFKEARIARISYCEAVTSGGSVAPRDLCVTYRAPICSWDGVSEVSGRLNPTAAICPSNSGTILLQGLFCTIGNNYNTNKTRCMEIDDNLGGGCVINPFNSTYQTVCRFQDDNLDDEMRRQRAKFCSGAVALDDINLCTGAGQNADDFLCASSGVHANPFVNFCAGVEHDAARADFLTSCQDNNAFTSACPTVLACMENPYGADCIYHRPYFASRWAIVEACAALEVGEYDATCTEDIRTAIQQDCLDEPYEGECKDNRDYASRRTARVNECAGYGDSATIRTTGGENETRCRVAIDDFCAGDNLFTTDGVECFTDAEYAKDDYLTDRNMHLAECQKAASARAPRTVCTEVSAHICVSAESEYTNPFLPVCDEDGRSSLVARQELILRCQPLDTTTRAEMGNEGCEIVKANMILTNCDDNPFHADCTDYSGAGQAYFEERTERVMACGVAVSETGARCDGTQARLCVSNTAEAAPLSPACNNVADIARIRNDFLEDCEDGSDVLDCDTTFATAVKTACDADPYVSAIPTADGSTVSCVDFASYDMERVTRLSECEGGRSDGCSETINIICLGDGTNANPFNTALCNGVAPDLLAIAQRDFCQIRANVGNDECAGAGKVLTRPTTATALASVDIGSADDVPSIPTAGADNEFLKGTDTGLNTNGFVQADGADAEVVVINMATAEYDGVPLGFDAADGIAFFVGRPAGGTERVEFYAGILAGADLGAVLAHEVGATVEWYGAVNWAILGGTSKGFNYQTGSGTDTTTLDFVLTIDLDAQTFSSLFSRPGTVQGFYLEGGYDATTGVITDGAVSFGRRDGERIATFEEANYFFDGPLIGIIGQEGALGVFHAQRQDDAQGESLAGGFVARPLRPDFFSWTVSAVDAADAPLTIRKTAVGNTAEASFIRGGTEALNVGTGVGLDGAPYTLTLADDYSLADSQDSRFGGNIVTLGGDESDGVSFAVDSHRLYSGLLSGTDVGAPLIVSASYRGLIGILIHKEGVTSYEIAHDFYLNANFDGTFNNGSATFSNGIFQIMRGKFNKFGLISGTVTLGDSSGTLSGLIGADGVVGSFISTDHTGGAFAGGFVAHTAITDLDPRDRITTIWRDNAVTDNGTDLDVLAGGNAVGSLNPLTNFIVGGGTALGLSGAQNITQKTLKADDVYTDSRGDTVRLDGIGAHGVAFARATILSENKWYAGLLSGTSLGNPVSHTAATAQWVGQVGLIKDGINSGNAYIAPLVLTVNFRDREISSPAIAIFADTLTINGRYDGHGLIRGTVSYATAGQTGVGHLTGLIGGGISAGAATAVGAFISGASGDDVGGYSGGFVVREPHGVTITEKVGYGDWVHSFGTPPPSQLDTATRRNQFLAGERDQVSREGTVSYAGFQISPAHTGNQGVSFDGIAQTLDNNNGLAFFKDTVDQVNYLYAGIHSQADLGNLLDTTFGGQAKGQWHGRFRSYTRNTTTTDFTLEIDFANSTIEAFVARGAERFHLNGDYDANGAIINGTVDYGAFNANTRVQADTRTPNGVLTGIIGQAGAIGVFISNATGNAGFAGGFIAVPNAVLGADTVAVNYNDWTYSFTPRPSVYLNTTNRVSQFLASHSGATALDETGAGTINAGDKGSLTLATATFKGDAFSGGQATDGVSWFWDTTNTLGYAGILSSTDLGAPLSQSGTAKWHGQFQATGGLSRDFLLEIDFTDSMITALVYHTGANYYHLAGSFGANGVITGTVKYGTFTNLAMPEDGRVANGILTGLIGAQGAVGAFISGTGDKNAITASDPVVNYAGGFVATPTAPLDDAVVNYDDWARSFATLPPIQVDPTTPPRRNQFLGTITGATALDDTGLAGTTDSRKVTLTLPDAPADGVGFIWDNSGVAGYAGILSSTNLGAPLSQANGKAEWEGTFQALVGAVGSDMDITSDFVLEINFANPNTVEALVQQAGANYYHLAGSFGANGVITGTVKYGTFTNLAMPEDGRVANGFLTGLIGEQGAVGAFLSGVGTKDAITAAPGSVFYSGGFVARPPAPDTDMVEYNDWWRSFATLPPRQLDTTTRGNQFLRTVTWENGLNEAGATAPSNGILSLTGVFEDTTLNGEDTDRVGFFWDQTNQAGYAGIHHTTNLGGRLVQGAGDATVEWAGVFQALNNAVKSDFVLTINFADNPDSISAFVKQAGANYYYLTGSFDANGVITGKVNYGTFSDTDTPTPTGDRLPNGILTGLIGSDGAVGVFISGTGTKDSITATDVKYVGGFVASPTAVNTGAPVNYSDWARSFGTPLPTVPDTTATPRNQFLQGLADTLPTTGLTITGGAVTPLNLAIATFDGIALGGQAADGVGFFVGVKSGVGTANYAGIFNGTDLGAPLVAGSQKAYWNGQFIAVGTFAVNTDFTLEIDFNVNDEVADSVGSIEAFVQQDGRAYYHLTGTYDDNGVIKGEVDFGNFTAGTRTKDGESRIPGTFTGLIGSDGAVGAFISERTLTYSGGFVANKTVADRVRFIDWTRSFDTAPDTAPNTTFTNQFLSGTADNITATATGLGANDGTGTITPELLDLSASNYNGNQLGGDAKNGVGFFQGYDTEGERYYYAGIFNGADLGAPLTQTSGDAEWKGRFQVVGNGDHDADFTLEVTFGAVSGVAGSAGKVEAFVLYEDTFHYHLTGTYDRNGVISGDVVLGKFTNNMKDMLDTSVEASTDGTLNGLIGQAGAIGVFHSDKTGSGGYSGGFVACPYDATNNRCQQ